MKILIFLHFCYVKKKEKNTCLIRSDVFNNKNTSESSISWAQSNSVVKIAQSTDRIIAYKRKQEREKNRDRGEKKEKEWMSINSITYTPAITSAVWSAAEPHRLNEETKNMTAQKGPGRKKWHEKKRVARTSISQNNNSVWQLTSKQTVTCGGIYL